MTKAEREYLSKVAALGCAICRRMGYNDTPACIHHRRTGTGAGKRSSHFDVVPLCWEHHQGDTGLHGMGRKAFERHYGITELELIAETKRMVGYDG